jgi:hypothetical protein
MFGLSDQQPQPQPRALQIDAPELRIEPLRPLDLPQGARNLGDLASRLIDVLTLSFADHADSVVQARSGKATVIAD